MNNSIREFNRRPVDVVVSARRVASVLSPLVGTRDRRHLVHIMYHGWTNSKMEGVDVNDYAHTAIPIPDAVCLAVEKHSCSPLIINPLVTSDLDMRSGGLKRFFYVASVASGRVARAYLSRATEHYYGATTH